MRKYYFTTEKASEINIVFIVRFKKEIGQAIKTLVIINNFKLSFICFELLDC